MKRSLGVALLFVLLTSISVTLRPGVAQSDDNSSLTEQTGYSGNHEDRPWDRLNHPASEANSLPVAAALYATDGHSLYLIDRTTGSETLIGDHGSEGATISALAFDDDGILYGLSLSFGSRLFTIDLSNGNTDDVGPLDVGSVFGGGLAFDASDQLYGATVRDSADSLVKMFTIDTITGAATILGPALGGDRIITGLASDGPTLYATDSVSNTLGTVDPSTGAYTAIGDPGVTTGGTGGLAIDPLGGTLY
ncbi:MAG TPA: hypothetical protein VLE70_08460, partial [Anaerolineae bacterium]|nr:hypothetical protein [Anaerolineae bacterium]